jgi:non-ribosomal peptide synthetase component F
MDAVPRSVHTVNLGGEPLHKDLVQRIYQLDHVRRVFNLYGPSEDTTCSTFAVVPQDVEQVTIGCPIANTQAYLLDEQQKPVPDGEVGELYLGGAGVVSSFGFGYRCHQHGRQFLRAGGQFFASGSIGGKY